jgi:hypothetical protein
MSRLQITLPIPKHDTTPIRVAHFGTTGQDADSATAVMFSSLGFTSDDGTPIGKRIPISGSFTFLCSKCYDSAPPHKQKVMVTPHNVDASELAEQLKRLNFQAKVV